MTITKYNGSYYFFSIVLITNLKEFSYVLTNICSFSQDFKVVILVVSTLGYVQQWDKNYLNIFRALSIYLSIISNNTIKIWYIIYI